MASGGLRALSGLRIVDLSEGLAGPFAAKLLGDLGADVIKIEPPGGDAARRRGPFSERRQCRPRSERCVSVRQHEQAQHRAGPDERG